VSAALLADEEGLTAGARSFLSSGRMTFVAVVRVFSNGSRSCGLSLCFRMIAWLRAEFWNSGRAASAG
jgi:hypothetical protein